MSESKTPDDMVSKAKRVVVPEELREIRQVPTFMGTKDEDSGKDYVQFPKWYSRTGVRTAEIDSGLGMVICRAATFDQEELESNVGWLKMTGALLQIPEEWVAEYDMVLKGDKGTVEVKEGEVYPGPRGIFAKQDPKLARAYWEECLPPSLAQQVIAAMMFMRLPPLVHIPREMDPKGE